MIVRAKAPLRISFCGGGTDVSPYPEEHGGCVLSATINHYATASLRPRRDSRLMLTSLDYDMVAKYDHPRRLRFDGRLDLLKAAVRALRVKRGAELWTQSDAPPGSGLTQTVTVEPGGLCRMALSTRMVTSWRRRRGSPITADGSGSRTTLTPRS